MICCFFAFGSFLFCLLHIETNLRPVRFNVFRNLYLCVSERSMSARIPARIEVLRDRKLDFAGASTVSYCAPLSVIDLIFILLLLTPPPSVILSLPQYDILSLSCDMYVKATVRWTMLWRNPEISPSDSLARSRITCQIYMVLICEIAAAVRRSDQLFHTGLVQCLFIVFKLVL